MRCIVADSGPLIALAAVDLLALPARLFEAAYITETVLAESLAGDSRPGSIAIRDSIAAHCYTVVPDPFVPPELADAVLDPGEQTALAYAIEHRTAVLIDEERGPDNHPELWLRF